MDTSEEMMEIVKTKIQKHSSNKYYYILSVDIPKHLKKKLETVLIQHGWTYTKNLNIGGMLRRGYKHLSN